MAVFEHGLIQVLIVGAAPAVYTYQTHRLYVPDENPAAQEQIPLACVP